MQSAPQNLLKEYVQSQKFTSTAEIMQAIFDKVKDGAGETGRNLAETPC